MLGGFKGFFRKKDRSSSDTLPILDAFDEEMEEAECSTLGSFPTRSENVESIDPVSTFRVYSANHSAKNEQVNKVPCLEEKKMKSITNSYTARRVWEEDIQDCKNYDGTRFWPSSTEDFSKDLLPSFPEFLPEISNNGINFVTDQTAIADQAGSGEDEIKHYKYEDGDVDEFSENAPKTVEDILDEPVKVAKKCVSFSIHLKSADGVASKDKVKTPYDKSFNFGDHKHLPSSFPSSEVEKIEKIFLESRKSSKSVEVLPKSKVEVYNMACETTRNGTKTSTTVSKISIFYGDQVAGPSSSNGEFDEC